MGLRETVIGILRNQHAQRIRFTFRGSRGTRISVDGTSFQRVAQAIENNQVHVHPGGVPRRIANYSARDEGERSANTLYVGGNNYRSKDFAGLIIHESVHASFDLTRTTLPWLDNETTAYIAQGFYLDLARYNLRRMNAGTQAYIGRMIANELREGGDGSGFWMDQMHNSLRSDPLYQGYICGTFHGDG